MTQVNQPYIQISSASSRTLTSFNAFRRMDDTENTYIIRPDHKHKFRATLVQERVHSILADFFSDKEYNTELALEWSQQLADDIKSSLKGKNSFSIRLYLFISLSLFLAFSQSQSSVSISPHYISLYISPLYLTFSYLYTSPPLYMHLSYSLYPCLAHCRHRAGAVALQVCCASCHRRAARRRRQDCVTLSLGLRHGSDGSGDVYECADVCACMCRHVCASLRVCV